MALEQLVQVREITERVRTAVLSLEECYTCRWITECTLGTADDIPVWLCLDCELGQMPRGVVAYDRGVERTAACPVQMFSGGLSPDMPSRKLAGNNRTVGGRRND